MSEFSPFYDVVYEILVARWIKNNTPLHCLAHSLNPKYDFKILIYDLSFHFSCHMYVYIHVLYFVDFIVMIG